MRYSAATILAMAGYVSAHTRMYSVWVNDVDQGDGQKVYIRTPDTNSPVKDITSADIVCNTSGGKKVDEFVSAAAGDSLAFEWYHDTRGDDIIAASHKGPVITYIAEYTETDGTGAIWTKIAEDGYDGSKWGAERVMSTRKSSFTVPSALAAGKYLIRQEIIALHEGDTAYTADSARGAQFYPSCVQVEITSGGSAVPNEGFDFQKGYSYSDPGILFNLYGAYSSYTIPGPAVWTGGDSGSSPASSSAVASATTSAAASSAPAASSSAPATSAAQASTTSAAASQPTVTATPSFTSVVTSAKPTATSAASSSSAAAPTSTKSPSTCSKKRSIRGGSRPKL